MLTPPNRPEGEQIDRIAADAEERRAAVRAAYATPSDPDYAELTEDWDQTLSDGLEAE